MVRGRSGFAVLIMERSEDTKAGAMPPRLELF